MSNATYIKNTINDLNTILLHDEDIKERLKDYIESLKYEFLIQKDNRKNIKSFISYLKKTNINRPLLQKSDYKDGFQYITNTYFALKLAKNYYIEAIPQVTEKDGVFPDMIRLFTGAKQYYNAFDLSNDEKNTIIKTCDLSKKIKLHFKKTDQNYLFDSNDLKYSLYFLDNDITIKTSSSGSILYACDNYNNESVFGALKPVNYTDDENNNDYSVIEV